MRASNRRGGRGRGLAAAARATAASKLAESAAAVATPSAAAVATPVAAIPPLRTSPRLQPSASSSLAASTSVNASISSETSKNQAPRSSTSSAENQMGVGPSTVATPSEALMERFDLSSANQSDDGSVSRKKGGEYDDNNDDDDSDANEKEIENIGGKDDEYNDTEIGGEVNFFAGIDDDSENPEDVGSTDYAAQDYDFFERVWHWMSPTTIITEKNRRAVEICILLEAGQAVDEGATTDENRLHENMRVIYTRLLRDIPSDHFESDAVYDAMMLQLKGGKEPSFSGKMLWRQQKEARKNVRSLAAEMPGAASFNSLPSGNSLRDAMKKLICKKFVARKGAKKTYEDVMDAWDDIHPSWWLEHYSIVHVLALMVHRQSPTIISAVANAEPGPTRDEQRAASAATVAAERRVESGKRHLQAKLKSGESALEKTYKSARVEGMKGVAMKHRITAAEMKLRMMNENREYYVAAAADAETGEAELNKKIKSVIDNLPDTFEDLTGDNSDEEEGKGD